MLSLIIGVTNMIPYFGPFLGGIPAVIITLLISPIHGVWVGLFILALQQFDGNFLGPKILGNSLDISPLWIILAVVVGGAVMGPLGHVYRGTHFCYHQNVLYGVYQPQI